MQCINFRNFSTASNNLTVLAHTRSLLAQNVSQPVRTPEPPDALGIGHHSAASFSGANTAELAAPALVVVDRAIAAGLGQRRAGHELARRAVEKKRSAGNDTGQQKP